MEINKNNYEAWLLDYFEGRLNANQVAELQLFLQQHPELDESIDEDFDMLSLEGESIAFGGKKSLKKEQIPLISDTNYEDYLVAEQEGLLTDLEKQQLDLFVAGSAKAQKDRSIYAKTKLVAGSAIRYPYKGKLKKTAGFTVPLFVRYAAAAAVALLALWFWPEKISNPDENGFAQVEGSEQVSPVLEKPLSPIVIDQREEIELADEPVVDQADNPEARVVHNEINVAAEQHQSNKKPDSKQPKLNGSELSGEHEAIIIANHGLQPIKVNPVRIKDRRSSDLIAGTNDIASVAVEEPKTPEGNLAEGSGESFSLLEYAGVQFKEEVLEQDEVTDGKLRENDIANAIGKGLEKLGSKRVDFKDKSRDKRVSYGFQIGKVGFSRSKTKK